MKSVPGSLSARQLVPEGARGLISLMHNGLPEHWQLPSLVIL